jgi:hypothetical protein
MKCSKYFGAKWRGFIKSESILAPKGASHFKTQNIRYDKYRIFFSIEIALHSENARPFRPGAHTNQTSALILLEILAKRLVLLVPVLRACSKIRRCQGGVQACSAGHFASRQTHRILK